MARAIAAAEQAEIDKHRRGIRIKPRRVATGRARHRWTPERIAQFERLYNAGATADAIAATMDMVESSSGPSRTNGVFLGKRPARTALGPR